MPRLRRVPAHGRPLVSPIRIIPAHLAHQLSEAQLCRAHLRFDGDEVDAVCGLTLGDHKRTEWHDDTTATRRWRVLGHDAEGMVKPGSDPLWRCAYTHEAGRCELLVHLASPEHSFFAAWEVVK